MQILALSGSLRAFSTHSALLHAAMRLAPPKMAVIVFEGLGELPLFNPDHEANPPRTVARFRTLAADADALLIASPEYAHSMTGAIKNALDWLVRSEPLASKPVAVLSSSSNACHADAALREVLRTMGAVIVEPASTTIPLLGIRLDEDGMLSSPSVANALRGSLAALYETVALRRTLARSALPRT